VVFEKNSFLTIFLDICFILLVFSHIFNMSNLIALSEEDLYAFGSLSIIHKLAVNRLRLQF